MALIIKSEHIDSNKYVLYTINDKNKKRKISKGFFKNNEAIKIDLKDNSRKYLLAVYPKYYSKIKWILLWLFLCVIELIDSCLTSADDHKKMYKTFYFEIPDEIDDVELIFNWPRYELTTNISDIKIKEKVKGRLMGILISIVGIIIIAFICFLYALFKIKHPDNVDAETF